MVFTHLLKIESALPHVRIPAFASDPTGIGTGAASGTVDIAETAGVVSVLAVTGYTCLSSSLGGGLGLSLLGSGCLSVGPTSAAPVLLWSAARTGSGSTRVICGVWAWVWAWVVPGDTGSTGREVLVGCVDIGSDEGTDIDRAGLPESGAPLPDAVVGTGEALADPP